MRGELNEIYNSIKKTNSPLVLRDLEGEYEKKLEDIALAKKERSALDITEEDLLDFLSLVKKLVEHPADALIDVHSYEHQIAVNKLFLEEFPTYDDIVNGTPKLTLFFKLLSSENIDEDVDVTSRRIELRLQA